MLNYAKPIMNTPLSTGIIYICCDDVVVRVVDGMMMCGNNEECSQTMFFLCVTVFFFKLQTVDFIPCNNAQEHDTIHDIS